MLELALARRREHFIYVLITLTPPYYLEERCVAIESRIPCPSQCKLRVGLAPRTHPCQHARFESGASARRCMSHTRNVHEWINHQLLELAAQVAEAEASPSLRVEFLCQVECLSPLGPSSPPLPLFAPAPPPNSSAANPVNTCFEEGAP